MSKTASALKDVLLSTIIYDQKELISIDSKATIKEALALLNEKKILSCPIWDDEKKRFCGLVTIWDIMVSLVRPLSWETFPREGASLNSPLTDIMGGEGDAFFVFEPTQTVETILEPFAVGIHRIFVHAKDDKTNKPTLRVLSQSDLIKFLGKNQDKLQHLMKEQVGDLDFKIGEKYPMTIRQDQPAIKGFQTMAMNGLSALPIIDNDGKIVATLSVSDVRGLDEKTLPLIEKPALTFLMEKYGENNIKNFVAPPSANLGEVFLMLLNNSIHRVWVVDDDQKPLGIISLSDVIRIFLPRK